MPFQTNHSLKFATGFSLCMFSLLAITSLFSKAMAENRERTFIMVKPDGVQRGLVGKIIERFEQKGFKLVAMKMMW
jgi:nucleoside-diphosphate kinase